MTHTLCIQTLLDWILPRDIENHITAIGMSFRILSVYYANWIFLGQGKKINLFLSNSAMNTHIVNLPFELNVSRVIRFIYWIK